MSVQKVLSPTITKINNVLPFKAAPAVNNYIDYDTFTKANEDVQNQEMTPLEITMPNTQAQFIEPQTQAIEAQDMEPVQIAPQKKQSNFLSGIWSLVKSIGLSVFVIFCANKAINAFGRKGGGFSSANAAGTRELGNKIWEDVSKFPKVEDLALPDGLKKLLDKVKRAVEKPDIVEQRGGKSLNSILLYGPPGTGKTTFAKALANMFPDSKFASLDVTSLGSEYRSVTERNLNNAVDMICAEAEKFPDKKFFVFVDEIDSVMMVDKGNGAKTSNDILNEFKKCFTEKLGKHKNIVTVGATNLDIDVDKATVVGGKMLDKPMLDRFEQKIYVGLPNASQMKQKIVSHYKNRSLVEDVLKNADDKKLQILVDTLADEKHNVSFRTLDSLIAGAADFDGDTTKVGFQHFIDAIKAKKVELNFTDGEIANLAKELGVKLS